MNVLNVIRILSEAAGKEVGGCAVSSVIKSMNIFTYVITAIFTLCYLYQYIYIPVSWFGKKEIPHASHKNRFGILICGRNEEAVIANLIDSLHAQNYPSEKIRIYVCADNCTDRTAEIARTCGATVYERNDLSRIGKGYALEFMLERIGKDDPDFSDAYIVFDADNIVDADFVDAMNDMLEAGYAASTCYRNTKNYSDNLVASAMGLWFIRESRYLNYPRLVLGSGSSVSGTGFMFSKAYLESIGGWHFNLLIEDIQFTVDAALRGNKIGYCEKAVTYDEQPTKFRTSWNQRIRWTRGYLQILHRYGARLIKKMFRGDFYCFDMFMGLSPVFFLCIIGQFAYALGLILSFFTGGASVLSVLKDIALVLGGAYGMFFMLGLFTTITEWSRIRANAGWKILTTFAFPISMILFLPITFIALFSKPEWKHITHDSRVTKDDLS